MQQYDLRVDDYIAKAPEFAKPILTHLRELVHQASPLIQETIKWGFPFFEYKGSVCNMAAFKQHCNFGFWRSSMLSDPQGILAEERTAANSLGRITDISNLPTDNILIAYIQEAVALNEKGVKAPAKPKANMPAVLIIPDYFADFLKQHPEAEAKFNQYSYSHKKEYVEWITEAKTEATRQKRMQTAAEWLAEGKSRHWKYQA